jgi:MFS family permease
MDERLISSSPENFPAEIEWNVKDLVKLALCWALTLTTSTLLTTIGPLAAKHTGASDILAPFTIGTFLIGAAVSSVPSGPLFRKYGRYGGFAVGCACQIVGSALGALGMVVDSQIFLYIGCFFVGLGQGLGQFYRFSSLFRTFSCSCFRRFAAVDISPPEFKSKAVTYVLSGGVIAAFLGPTSANYSIHIVSSSKYCGSFLVMGGIGLLNWFTLSLVNFPSSSDEEEEIISANNTPFKPRTPFQIVSHPVFILSCTVATIAHTVMVMIMSNCALSMEDDYSFQTTSLVLEFHFLAMFLPGFLTGKLIQEYGTFVVSIQGALLFALSSVFFGLGEHLWNYYGGMILLGIAWNLSFSAGTVMLTSCYAVSSSIFPLLFLLLTHPSSLATRGC